MPQHSIPPPPNQRDLHAQKAAEHGDGLLDELLPAMLGGASSIIAKTTEWVKDSANGGRMIGGCFWSIAIGSLTSVTSNPAETGSAQAGRVHCFLMGGGSGRKTAEGHLLAEFSEIRRQSRHGGAGRRVPAHAG